MFINHHRHYGGMVKLRRGGDQDDGGESIVHGEASPAFCKKIGMDYNPAEGKCTGLIEEHEDATVIRKLPVHNTDTENEG